VSSPWISLREARDYVQEVLTFDWLYPRALQLALQRGIIRSQAGVLTEFDLAKFEHVISALEIDRRYIEDVDQFIDIGPDLLTRPDGAFWHGQDNVFYLVVKTGSILQIYYERRQKQVISNFELTSLFWQNSAIDFDLNRACFNILPRRFRQLAENVVLSRTDLLHVFMKNKTKLPRTKVGRPRSPHEGEILKIASDYLIRNPSALKKTVIGLILTRFSGKDKDPSISTVRRGVDKVFDLQQRRP